MIIIGTKFLTWGNEQTAQPVRCPACQVMMPFTVKKGMRFVTIFFVIPVLPLSGVKTMLECPNCRTKFNAPG